MNKEVLMKILLSPLLTEKSVRLAENKRKQFSIKVARDATKPMIKEAVQALYSVSVHSVNVVNQRGKSCRFKMREGKHSDWKKAYVTLKENFDINFGGRE